MHYTKKIVVILISTFLLAEGSVRVLGLADVPIRSANNITGYIPLPNQNGSFLLNDWHVNNLSMISRSDYQNIGDEVIIAGDSVVFGGNPLAQDERIGEQLNDLISKSVYSIADGSWGFKNSLSYLINYEQFLSGVEAIVFVLNSGDFSTPSSWRCFSTHPTSAPLFHTYFVFRKYFKPDCEAKSPPSVLVKDFDANTALNQVSILYRDTKLIFVLYQNKREYDENLTLRHLVNNFEQVSNGRVEVAELINFSNSSKYSWDLSYYRDDIHPTQDGAAIMARIIGLSVGAF